jgi:oxalate decarboxylase/phosphoglucose isomerase-like protein (cupin superfamily)
VGVGDVVFVPPSAQHTYVNAGDVPFKFLCGIPVSRLMPK